MHRRLIIALKVEGTDKETRHSFEYRKQGEVEAEMDLTDAPHQFVVNRLMGLLEAVAIAADHVWPRPEANDMSDEFREADAMLTATPVPLVPAVELDEDPAVIPTTSLALCGAVFDGAPCGAPEGSIIHEHSPNEVDVNHGPTDICHPYEPATLAVETPVGDTIETAGEQDAGERELEF